MFPILLYHTSLKVIPYEPLVPLFLDVTPIMHILLITLILLLYKKAAETQAISKFPLLTPLRQLQSHMHHLTATYTATTYTPQSATGNFQVQV